MERIRKLLQRKLLLSTISIMLLLIALPLLISLYMYQSWSRDAVTTKCSMQMQQLAKASIDSVQGTLSRIRSTGIFLGFNKTIEVEYAQSTPATQNDVTDLLKGYRGVLGVNNLLFTFEGSRRVYTAYGTTYIPYYEDSQGRSWKLVYPDNIKFSKEYRITSSLQGETILASDEDTVEVLYPLRRGTAILGFQLTVGQLFPVTNEHMALILMDQQGRVLCTTDRKLAAMLGEDGLASAAADSGRVTVDGTDYLVSSASMEGCTLLCFSDETWFYAESRQSERRFFLLYGAAAILCCLLVVLIVYYVYRPVSRVQIALRPFMDRNARYKNEMESVEKGFDRLFSQYRSLEQSALRRRRTETVLSLAEYSAGVTREELISAGMENLKGFMHFSIMRVHSREGISKQAAAEELISAVPEGIAVYTAPYHDTKGFLLLTASDRNRTAELEKTFRDFLEGRNGVYIGMGGTVERPEALSESYVQARAALSMYHRSDADIPLFTQIPRETGSGDTELQEKITALFNAVASSDYRQSRSVLDSVFADISARPALPVLHCYNAVNEMLRAGRQNRLIAEALDKNPGDLSFDQVEFADASDFMAFANELLELIFSTAEEKDDCFGACCAQIQTMLLDPSLCSEIVAEKQGMSMSALQRIFKDHTGSSPSAYILAMRQDYAKNQLLSTDITVQELGKQLGYSQASSFIRTFKREEGMTPGEYRQKYLREFE